MEPGVEPRVQLRLFQQAEDGGLGYGPDHIKELRLLGRADWVWTTWVPRLNAQGPLFPTLCLTLFSAVPLPGQPAPAGFAWPPYQPTPHLPSSSSPPSRCPAPDTLEARKKALDRAPDVGSAALEQGSAPGRPGQMRGGPGNHLLALILVLP